MKERLLFVAAGLAQAPAIQDAREAGYYTIAMDGDPSAPGLALANEAYVANILDSQEITRIAKETRAQGVVSLCCDVAMEAMADACAALHLPGIPREVVRVSRNKLLQRDAMRAAGLYMPSYFAVNTAAESLTAWDNIAADACVIKPADASGSRGVSFVSNRDRVPTAFELARQNSKSGCVMVESFVPGIEYSVEAWMVGSRFHLLATSEKLRTQPPYLLDRQVNFPDSLTSSQRQTMVEHAERAILACGFMDCPVHLECIYSADGPMIVELAARGAGFKVFTEILPRVTGISTVEASIQAALGKKPDLTVTPGPAATLAFIDPRPGIFRQANGVDQARALPGVSEVTIYPEPGRKLQELRSGADRAGHVMVYAKDSATARAITQQAIDLIDIEVDVAM